VNVLSLFSGIGGFELGLERAGMTVVGQVEINPFGRAVLRAHWPHVPQHEDVRTAVDWWTSKERPQVDVICGGFPCQDISNAGKRAGITGARSGLWGAMLDTVRRLRPRYVLVENVSALAVRGLDTVLADLAGIGFDAEWATLRACDFGAPHNRERLFILAYSQDLHGVTRGRLEQSASRRPQIELGGLFSPSLSQRRRSADSWLAREPKVDRMVDGIPAVVDRLAALGNAVVPAVAEHIGRQLIQALEVAA
jgi:DNA (cytosine-5)-methyltransferase 1